MGRYLCKPMSISQRPVDRILLNKVGQKWSWVRREEPKSRVHHLFDPHMRLLGSWSENRCHGTIRNHSSHCSKFDPSHPIPSFAAGNVGQNLDF